MGVYLVDYVINNVYETYSTILGDLNQVAECLDNLYKKHPLTFIQVTDGTTDSADCKEIDLEPLVRTKNYIVTYEMKDDVRGQEQEKEFNNFEDCYRYVNGHLEDFESCNVMEYSIVNLNLGKDVTDLFY